MASGKEVKVSADDHNAFFYSLVSTDTEEMYFSTKRQQFLIQQGYAFKVVTDLIGDGDKAQLKFSTREAQVELLEKVLRLGEAEAGEEVLPEDQDAITRGYGAGEGEAIQGEHARALRRQRRVPGIRHRRRRARAGARGRRRRRGRASERHPARAGPARRPKGTNTLAIGVSVCNTTHNLV